MTGKPHPRRGDEVRIEWRDIEARLNGVAHTPVAHSMGRVKKWGRLTVLLEGTWYDDAHHNSHMHDTIAIPRGCVDDWEITRKRKGSK